MDDLEKAARLTDAADALWDMGESEWRELMHEHHGWQRKYKELEKDARLTCEEDS